MTTRETIEDVARSVFCGVSCPQCYGDCIRESRSAVDWRACEGSAWHGCGS